MSEKTIELDEALKLLALPRELGKHPPTAKWSWPARAGSART